ncbi:pre-mRNA-processing factor 17-like isoform X1 [Portunus trituberculatus]|uniref:pre-mRNA-processing factor 17-like isoform X1 n=1 Tax=Portunus trituberculatus TaxID=210409 RepID=UPI001E1CDA22|nr:pre-mRNA-processing factor 17-like isoform X1 [Portunus trituberculatus]
MASLLSLRDYGSESESDLEDSEELVQHLKPIESAHTVGKDLQLVVSPEVTSTKELDDRRHIDPSEKELKYNPKYDELYAPVLGPEALHSKYHEVDRNSLAGHVETAHFNDFEFESQRRTFTTYGYAVDPSISGHPEDGRRYIGDLSSAKKTSGITVFETQHKADLPPKRRRDKNDDASDTEGFKGPWAKFENEKTVMKPSEEEQHDLDEILAKRQKRRKQNDDKPIEEKSLLHIKDAYDYQGRSFLHIPQDVGVNLKSPDPPEKCFMPKKLIHTWKGHTKGVAAIRWFPKSAHLLLSCSMDTKIKIWEVFNNRRCIRTYMGHKQAVRDACFDNTGKQFLSAGYDRFIKLWDTETGDCISRFPSRKIPYCVKFNPDDGNQNLFVAGTSDKKIVCWDIRSAEIVQEYDRHLGAVNTITFIDENRRFVSTSDDKSLRVWEWDIPVDFKYIADPSMHSMPAVTLSPNKKWLACQSMDNKIVIFSALDRFKMNRKKVFTGHMVAGYACTLDFSPDMSYLVSGDADGKAHVWDWKTTKLYQKWKAHDDVCIGILWHPHETSKIATAGWDGLIKYWD